MKLFEILQIAQARRTFTKEENKKLVAQVLLYDINEPSHSWGKFTQRMTDQGHPLDTRDPKTLNGRLSKLSREREVEKK